MAAFPRVGSSGSTVWEVKTRDGHSGFPGGELKQ